MPRLSCNINGTCGDILARERDRHGVSITETVRRAFAVYDLIVEHVRRGGKVLVEDPNGDTREVILLP